jgi:hypothetical protein
VILSDTDAHTLIQLARKWSNTAAQLDLAEDSDMNAALAAALRSCARDLRSAILGFEDPE